ncbi:hypothetical protein Phum_PHUM199460 [Pediculus humanus corporis]|uniref:Uncharacterized protein n=1 Tax=Pediculus humanus subsp. corporis TaxID=121224 RepID=E0VH26_PEDHC|nr:uncharacterized protein Phum_PHUM199460 [Pediculus humanus corporis]EEB12682.1 hypothetical protein Phum_PHUM199460 [Pediculus humanus corporis]
MEKNQIVTWNPRLLKIYELDVGIILQSFIFSNGDCLSNEVGKSIYYPFVGKKEK